MPDEGDLASPPEPLEPVPELPAEPAPEPPKPSPSSVPRRLTSARKPVDPTKPPLRAATHVMVPENLLVVSRRRWVRTFAGLTFAAAAFVVGDLMAGLCPLGPKIGDKVMPLIADVRANATVGPYAGWIALGVGAALLITLMCVAAKRFWWPLIPAVLLAGGAFVSGVATVGDEGGGREEAAKWKERAEKAEATLKDEGARRDALERRIAELDRRVQDETAKAEALQRSLDERAAEFEKLKKRAETAEAQIQPYERTMMDLMNQKKKQDEQIAALQKEIEELKKQAPK